MNTRRQFVAASAATIAVTTLGTKSVFAELEETGLTLQNASFIESAGAASTPAASPEASPETTELRGYIFGDPEAPNTLRIFGDYRCPHCRAFAKDTEPQLIEEFVKSGQLNLEFVDFTVIQVPSFEELGDDSIESVQAAEAAACAAEQDGYLAYRDWLFSGELVTEDGGFSNENLIAAAEELGLDADQFGEALESGKYEQAIIESVTLGLEIGVQGTPTFTLNDGEPFFAPEGGYEPFKSVIEPELN